MLILAAFITPLIEFLDRWDPPGLGNDTEQGVFALILVLCLVLLVCKLITSLCKLIDLALSPCPPQAEGVSSHLLRRIAGTISPHTSPPLRI